MRIDHDDWGRQNFEDRPPGRPRAAGGWWVAAAAAVVALVGTIAFLSVWPAATRLRAAQDRGVAQARVDDPAHRRKPAAANTTGTAEAAAGSAIQPRAHATEAAAQAGALEANATAQDASATAAAPPP